MQVNFFDLQCCTQTSKSDFGICDDPPPSITPAYLDHTDRSKWIEIVDNPSLKEISFYAVDKCVHIFRETGEEESRCDGFLSFNNNVIFVELKDRAYIVVGFPEVGNNLL